MNKFAVWLNLHNAGLAFHYCQFSSGQASWSSQHLLTLLILQLNFGERLPQLASFDVQHTDVR